MNVREEHRAILRMALGAILSSRTSARRSGETCGVVAVMTGEQSTGWISLEKLIALHAESELIDIARRCPTNSALVAVVLLFGDNQNRAGYVISPNVPHQQFDERFVLLEGYTFRPASRPNEARQAHQKVGSDDILV